MSSEASSAAATPLGTDAPDPLAAPANLRQNAYPEAPVAVLSEVAARGFGKAVTL